MQTGLKPQSPLLQLLDLTLIQLSNWRWSWRGMLLTSLLAPLMSTIALGIFARQSGEATLGYILAGNLVLALTFSTLDKVAGNFAFMRFRGMLDYFASLPLRSANLVLATILAFFLLALPSVFATLALGALYLGVGLDLHPLALLVLPLAATSMAGLGALIGASVRSPEEANSLSTLLTLLMMGLGPVLVPPERLPAFLVTAGYFSPAAYAASALRQTLLGPLTGRIWLDLGVLLGLSILVLWLVGRRMSWRRSLT